MSTTETNGIEADVEGVHRASSWGTTKEGAAAASMPLSWWRWLVAPLLAAGATVIHFAVNVPDDIQQSPRDQGMEPLDPRRSRPARPPAFAPRSDARLTELWSLYQSVPIAEEPVDSGWARPFQAHVNKAVIVARTGAFEGAPEPPQVILTEVECHTIRCRFVLRGPYAHEVTLLARSIERLHLADVPMWRHFVAEQIQPPGDSAPKDEVHLQITVGFVSDQVDNDDIRLPTVADDSDSVEGDDRP